jgi:thiol:disulfide interchange protein
MPPRADDAGGSTRRTPQILLVVAIALLAARIVLSFNDHTAPKASPVQMKGSFSTSRQAPGSAGQHELVEWRPIDAGPAEAASTNKPILYDFTAAWCPPCRMLNREVFSDPASAAWINEHFVPVQVMDRAREEGHNPPEVQALQSHYRINAFPTLIMVAPGGGEPVVIDGYRGRTGTMAVLADAAQKAQQAQ